MSALPITSQPTSLVYIWRSVLYALLSGTALYCGYLLSSGTTDLNDQVLLIAFFATCFPFFVAYSAVFPRNETRTPQEPRATFTVTLGLGLVGAYALLLKHRIDTGHDLPLQQILHFGAISAVFLVYGAYLLWRFDKPITPLVRHQLVWSALLTVGVMFYVGMMFPALQQSFQPAWPLFIIGSTVVFSEIFHRRQFATFWTSLVHGLFAIFVMMTWATLAPDLTKLFGCVALSAYLAVFEAWSTTSEEAQKARKVVLGQHTVVGRYFNATLLALIISGSTLPMLYLFTTLSPWLLVFVGVHLTTAFLIWFAARTNDRLIFWPWKLLRIALGSTFLMALAADSRFFSAASLTPLPLPKSPLLYVLLAAASAPVLVRLPDVLRDWQNSGLAGLLSSASRFVGIVFYLAAFGVGISILIYTSEYSPALIARATYTCVIYFSFWLFSGAYIVRKFFQKPPTGMLGGVFAMLALTRALTSFLIGGAVAAVTLAERASLLVAILNASPFTLAAMGGFALNDYCDRERDRINRPYRPVPSGKVAPATAYYVGFGLLLAATAFSLAAAKSARETIIFLLAITGAASYNIVVRRATCLKNLWTGALCSLPLLWFASEGRISGVVVVSVLIYITGREMLMDVVDMRGDQARNVLTIPSRIGSAATSIIGFVLVLGGSVLFGLAFAGLAITCLLVAMVGGSGLMWWLRRGTHRSNAIYVLWVPLLVGVASLYRK